MKISADHSINPLTRSDIHAVARIHMKAFDDSALTHLGLEPVMKYYHYLLTFQNKNFNIGCFDHNNSLLGFCFSGMYSGSLSGFLNQNRSFLRNWIMLHPWKIFNPLILNRIKIALRIYSKPFVARNNIPPSQITSFGILSIAVDPDSQGSGFGKIIMEAVEQQARDSGVLHLHLTVHQNNMKAVQFYEKCGWQKVINNIGEWDGRMAKQLTS